MCGYVTHGNTVTGDDHVDSDDTIGKLDPHCQFRSIEGGQDTDTEDEDSVSGAQEPLRSNRLRRTYAVQDLRSGEY